MAKAWGEDKRAMEALTELHIRHSMANYIQRWITTPGRWGGDDFSGLDCSGAIHETLQAYGLERRGYDCTANDLFRSLEDNIVKGMPREGDLVFWLDLDGDYATHVEMIVEVIGDHIFTCGASGVSKKTGYQKSEDEARRDAIRDNAYVMRNKIDYRGTNYKIVSPFKE